MSLKEVERSETIKRSLRKELTVKEVSEMTGLSERQTYRLRKKIKEKGVQSLVHGNQGRRSNNRVSDREKERIARIIQEYYHDFKPTLATEKLKKDHHICFPSETVRRIMIEKGLWEVKRRKSVDYRSRRKRKDHYGEMIQFDGSYHDWFEEGEKCCLLAGIDDATGRMIHAEFVKNENLQDIFSFFNQYFLSFGKPLRIYLDKLNAYYNNLVEDREKHLTQFQRAMREMDVETISAHSPEAKGRVERLFKTLQDRLVKEMRLKGISDKSSGNKYLKEEFIPFFNDKYGNLPTKKGNFHRELNEEEKELLFQILSEQKQRVVQNDFCIRHKNRFFQLSKEQPATVRKKEKVVVEERMDKTTWIRLRDKYLNFKEIKKEEQINFSENEIPWILPANTKTENKKVEITVN